MDSPSIQIDSHSLSHPHYPPFDQPAMPATDKTNNTDNAADKSALDAQLILVDGTAFLFRAYHAIRPLTNAAGQTTHAVLGMMNMLRKLQNEYCSARLAVVMDAKGKTFRHRMYREYKANRPPMPDDLRAQNDYVQKIVPAMGLPLLSTPDVEADDVIGTLARAAEQKNWRTMIVSADKDLAQLVGERVWMLDTMKNTRLDIEGVRAKFGVLPEQIVDYLALVGDTSDNIPGVPGVGAKTAAKWLAQFGTLDKLVVDAAEISGKVGESLRDNIEQLALSRQLATIKCDVELEVDVDALQIAEPDLDALRVLCAELGFESWLKKLGGEADGEVDDAQPQTPQTNYETISDLKTLTRWINKLKKAGIFAIDTETTSTDAHRAELVGVSFSSSKGDAAYLPLAHRYAGAPKQASMADALAQLRPLLEDARIKKVGQNIKYDLAVLARNGIVLDGIAGDTMLMSYLLDAGNSRHDMDTLARKHLNRATIKYADVAGSGKKQLTFDQVDVAQATQYAAEDADVTLQLHDALAPRIEAEESLRKLFIDIEMPLVAVLARTEANGVAIDAAMLRKQSAQIAQRLTRIEANVFECAGEEFNIASPRQIQEILYEKQGIAVLRKTPKGQPSTAESVLQELAHEHELPRLILEHRALAKLKSTYTDKLPALINPDTGRIHTSYHQAVAATGRLSSSDPNLQNIPIRSEDGRQIRAAFVAAPGNVLMSADYSQIELRIMAHLSGDAGLVEAFANNVDVHSATASEVFGVSLDEVDAEQRRRAKAINFGLIYGMSAFGLARQLKIDQHQARNYIEIYFQRYPGVKAYMDETKIRARERGYVETLYGRRLNLPEIAAKNAQRRQYAERTAINAPMQGTAADLIKRAMLAVDGWLLRESIPAKIILQVHDELVLEVAQNAAEQVAQTTAELMAQAATLDVPLVVDTGIGANWKEAH